MPDSPPRSSVVTDRDASRPPSAREAPPAPPAGPRRGITPRAVFLGFLLVPVNSFWIVYTEVIRYAAHPTTTSLFFNVVFCVCVLVALNAFLKRYLPRHAFSQGELLVIYTILSLGTAMVGHDMMQVLVSTIAYPYRFATPENRWKELFFGALPAQLIVTDPEAVKAMWAGGSSFYQPSIFMAWVRPILLWTGFFTVMLFVMMCLNVVWRKQWTENERLAFPIIELPLQMTDESFALFRNRMMWAGFVLAGGIDLLNTISMSFPAMPHIPTREVNLQQMIVDRPWNAMGSVPIQFLPFVLGLGFLLPLDLLFSSWFFFFFWKMQVVVTAALGANDGRPNFPYIPEQSAGAYLGVAVFVVWVSRHYLQQVFRRAMGKRSHLDDSREPMTYRAALLGIVGGLAVLVLFAVWSGVTLWVAGAFFLIYFMLSISVSRMRAELGSPAHDLHYAGPDHLLTVMVGPRDLSKQTLAFFAASWGFNRAYRSHPMPHQLEGFKLAQVTGIRMAPLMWLMLAAGVWGCLCAFWALLATYYHLGAATAKIQVPGVPQIFGREPWERLARWTTPPGPLRDPAQTWFVLLGLGFSAFLTLMRGQFLWWPFHPVGLAVSSSWAMGYMWFSLMIAWMLKYAILRGTGLRGYRNALPFFLGLILGEFVVGSLCNIAGLLFGFELYRFWG
jgi:hypothetical protein